MPFKCFLLYFHISRITDPLKIPLDYIFTNKIYSYLKKGSWPKFMLCSEKTQAENLKWSQVGGAS